jgi:hypothetical protein
MYLTNAGTVHADGCVSSPSEAPERPLELANNWLNNLCGNSRQRFRRTHHGTRTGVTRYQPHASRLLAGQAWAKHTGAFPGRGED